MSGMIQLMMVVFEVELMFCVVDSEVLLCGFLEMVDVMDLQGILIKEQKMFQVRQVMKVQIICVVMGRWLVVGRKGRMVEVVSGNFMCMIYGVKCLCLVIFELLIRWLIMMLMKVLMRWVVINNVFISVVVRLKILVQKIMRNEFIKLKVKLLFILLSVQLIML